MGVAAYNRGSLVISRGLGFDREPTHKPEPRPPDWGSKARAKADRRAAGLVAYFNSKGIALVVEDLADMIREETKCGKATARAAAEGAIRDRG